VTTLHRSQLLSRRKMYTEVHRVCKSRHEGKKDLPEKGDNRSAKKGLLRSEGHALGCRSSRISTLS
jgi:hypothetical protein